MEKDEDNSSVECAECLNTALVTSPRLVVWTALEASKQKIAKNFKTSPPSKTNRGYLKYLIIGVILCLYGISSFIWKPYDVLMSERLEMRRGLPPYEWWVDPPDEVLLSVYLFNITNSEEFIGRIHEKLKLEEIGPIIYREKLTHSDVEFHSNNTMSYTATRTAIFLPELNSIDLDSTIVVPNLAVLGMSSYLWNASFTMKFGFNMLMTQAGSKPLVKVTIRDYLWNLTDPVVKAARVLVPHLVPKENFGVLQQIYEGYSDRVTVYIGRGSGPRKFFQVNRYNGRLGLGAWSNATCDSVEGSTEGVGYHQEMRKEDVVWYLRKAFCRAAPLYYTGDYMMSGMNVYKFELSNDTFSRPMYGNECFLQDGLPALPSGLTDASPCYHNFPIATSFPHFMNADPATFDRIEGLKPNYSKHHSYVYVEPNTGIPLTAAARSQSNLVIRPIKSGFSRIRRFFNMTIPMFWAEYRQVGLPVKVTALTYFTVVLVANYQLYFSMFVMAMSLLCFYVAYRRTRPGGDTDKAQVLYSSLPIPTTDKPAS